MDADRFVERGIAVFSNWAVFGAAAIGFLMEGIARQTYALSLVGVTAAIAGFLGHLLVNAYFGETFSRGETGLGLATLSAIVVIFIIAWLVNSPAEVTVWTGLTLIATLIGVGAVYLATRFGVRNAFSHFHKRSATGRRR